MGDWPFLPRRWRPWGVLRRRIFQGPWAGSKAGSLKQDHLLGQRLAEVPWASGCCGVGDVQAGPRALLLSCLHPPPWLRAPS